MENGKSWKDRGYHQGVIFLRLDRFLANSKIGTRKEVKRLIKAGAVKVNGKIVKDPSFDVKKNDTVEVKGNRVEPPRKVYIVLNKPKGFVSSTRDPKDPTIVDLIDHPYSEDLFPVGRLDKDTEGLIILTNDGEFAHKVISPKYAVEREYLVRVDKRVNDKVLGKLTNGVKLRDGHIAKAKKVEILSEDGRKISLVLTEGKYHEVKRMLSAVGLKVLSLKRIRLGNLKLDENMPLGGWRELDEREVASIFERGNKEKNKDSA